MEPQWFESEFLGIRASSRSKMIRSGGTCSACRPPASCTTGHGSLVRGVRRGDYSALTSLGGSMLRVPSLVSLEKAVYDVVALGTGGKLQHKHYDGSGWSAEWEDLEIRAHSAPSVVAMGDRVVCPSCDGVWKPGVVGEERHCGEEVEGWSE